MIAKPPARAASPRRRPREPLDVRLTFKLTFGDEPGDSVTVMNERRVPMVNSVFDNRDRILRAFALTLVKVGMAQPKVVREIFPAIKFLRRGKRPKG